MCYLVSSLVSIVTKEEQIFVNEFIRNSSTTSSLQVWIGLRKNPLTDAFEWMDGSILGFTAFASSQQSQPCIYLQNGLWYDSECLSNRRKYICKSNRGIIFDILIFISVKILKAFNK